MNADGVPGFKFDEFEIDRVTHGPKKGVWRMHAAGLNIAVDQEAAHMSPATIYNFSIRAATEIMNVSRRLAITEKSIETH